MSSLFRRILLATVLAFTSYFTQAQVSIYSMVPQSGTSNTTWSINCEGYSPEVIVLVHFTGFKKNDVTVTDNSNSSNPTGNINSNSDYLNMYMFSSPALGTHTISLSVTGTGTFYAEAIVLNNVTDVNSISISVNSNSSGTSATTGNISAGSNDMILGGVFGDLGSINSSVATSVQANLTSAFSSPYIGVDSYVLASKASSLAWSFSNNSDNATWVTLIHGISVLPISLLNFNVQYISDKNIVAIDWSTATEVNNKLFTIEKTTDNVNFTDVATVAGAGNSDNVLQYTATDENPSAGVSYYRLKQTDNDGTSTYSQLMAVTLPVRFSENIYPNPAIGNTTLSYSANSTEPVSLRIFDLAGNEMGSEVFSTVQVGENHFDINTSMLAQGMYIMQIAVGSQVTSHRFCKQ